jgi:hypothetical protein
MYEFNQIEVPPAFMAIYCRHGRPFESQATIETRYEACEDLAQQVGIFCQTLEFKEDIPQDQILLRCHAGLLASPDTVSESESFWVVARAAELLEWLLPDSLQGEAR